MFLHDNSLREGWSDIFVLMVWQVATLIAVYANWGFAKIKGVGWGWAGVIWLYSVVFYVPLDFMKFAIRYILSGKAWLNLLENKVFTYMKDFISHFGMVSFLYEWI